MQNLVVDIDTNGFRALGIACIRLGGYGSQAADLGIRIPLATLGRLQSGKLGLRRLGAQSVGDHSLTARTLNLQDHSLD